MSKYIIIDDFLSVGDPKELKALTDLKSLVMSSQLNYRLYDVHYGEYDTERYVCPKQFSHHIYINDNSQEYISPNFSSFQPIFLKLKKYFGNYQLLRAKINISCIELSGKFQPPHFDLKYDDSSPASHWVFLYYINDSDGDTLFFKNEKETVGQENEVLERVTPKENRAVLFDGSLLHAASNPAKTFFRIVMNVDVRPEFTPV